MKNLTNTLKNVVTGICDNALLLLTISALAFWALGSFGEAERHSHALRCQVNDLRNVAAWKADMLARYPADEEAEGLIRDTAIRAAEYATLERATIISQIIAAQAMEETQDYLAGQHLTCTCDYHTGSHGQCEQAGHTGRNCGYGVCYTERQDGSTVVLTARR